MPTMSASASPTKRARCITAISNIARSTARPRRTRRARLSTKASKSPRSRCCRTTGIDRGRMSPNTFPSWQVWAVLSASFAALTAIFAKIGVEDINSDLATLIRTVVVLLILALILFATGQFNQTGPISTKSWIFLVLSGLGTGASWICYFRALKLGPATLVAPIDKLSVVLVALFGVVFLGERPSLNGWLGIALIATGAVLIAFKRKQRSGR